MICTDCPRNCKVERKNLAGFCGETQDLRIAWAGLHFGEEPLLTVNGGSGTIFVTGCNLRCAFCQNYQISQNGIGEQISVEEFAKICIELQKSGAENINIVTGSHHARIIAEGLKIAKKNGLSIPICWNSSGFDSIESLEMLADSVQIYLPDLKTLNPILSKNLCDAQNYPEVAKNAIEFLLKKFPLKIQKIDEKEKIISGVIIRHLFLPGHFEETAETLAYLKENADGKAIISLMNQYTPVEFDEDSAKLKKRKNALKSIENRLVNKEDDADLRDLIDVFDFEYLFYQELCASTDWLPDFTNVMPFPNNLAKTIWHYSCGFVSDLK